MSLEGHLELPLEDQMREFQHLGSHRKVQGFKQAELVQQQAITMKQLVRVERSRFSQFELRPLLPLAP